MGKLTLLKMLIQLDIKIVGLFVQSVNIKLHMYTDYKMVHVVMHTYRIHKRG